VWLVEYLFEEEFYEVVVVIFELVVFVVFGLFLCGVELCVLWDVVVCVVVD